MTETEIIKLVFGLFLGVGGGVLLLPYQRDGNGIQRRLLRRGE